MAVTVKTPACPTVVCPPPADADGAWLVKTTADACDARFIGPDGTLLGFALLGAATSLRQALVATVPALLPG
jgi:rubredoxin-NAD+ reductase